MRELRGFALLSDPENIKPIRKNVWYVRSQSNTDIYFRVERKWPNGYCGTRKYVWSCTCPDHVFHNQICKHIYAVEFSLKLKTDNKQETTHQEVAYINPDVVCPICLSVSSVRNGCRVTRFGKTQRYTCKNCGHRFTPDKGFKNMKHDPKIITLTLDLYFKGVSLRKIVDHLKQFHDMKVSQTIPLRWIKKYMKILGNYVEKNKADVGKVWHADEMTVFLKKKGEKRYFEWIWNVIDAETHYLLACQVTKDRHVADEKKPMMQAKNAAARRPDLVVTDGLRAISMQSRTCSMINLHSFTTPTSG
jgi:transposase-like protein